MASHTVTIETRGRRVRRRTKRTVDEQRTAEVERVAESLIAERLAGMTNKVDELERQLAMAEQRGNALDVRNRELATDVENETHAADNLRIELRSVRAELSVSNTDKAWLREELQKTKDMLAGGLSTSQVTNAVWGRVVGLIRKAHQQGMHDALTLITFDDEDINADIAEKGKLVEEHGEEFQDVLVDEVEADEDVRNAFRVIQKRKR